MTFNAEKHGRGPEHVSAPLKDSVLEIYPPMKRANLSDAFYIAATVADPEVEKQVLIAQFGGSEAEPPVPTTASGIATLRDPDGRLVRLFPG